jgi:hypothetical protein
MIEALLDKTLDHQRQVPAQDAIGGNAATWTAIASSIPCAIWGSGSSIAKTFLRRDSIVDNCIVTASDLGAKAGDRFVIGGSYYLFNGSNVFNNNAICGDTVYVIDATLRTV